MEGIRADQEVIDRADPVVKKGDSDWDNRSAVPEPTANSSLARYRRKRRQYMDLFEGFGPREMGILAEVKRFMECYEGDRKFRASVDAGGQFTDEQRQTLKDIGVTFEPEAMALLWLKPELVDLVVSMTHKYETFEEAPADIHEMLASYPEMRIWLLWTFRRSQMFMIHKILASAQPTLSPEYTAWRNRQVSAVRNELGWFGWSLDNPCHAVEMAVGCSVGCGFCAFDAPKLQVVFDLSKLENRELVCEVAKGMVDVLGWPAGHGMLYWSTEPHDNPHYVKLLGLWESMTGAKLCTATARAGEDWVRDLIDYYTQEPTVPWPRISVLSRKIMYRLHKAFTPLEMMHTSLLMQQSDGEDRRRKVPGGREKMLKQLIDADDLRDVDLENMPEDFAPPQGSIACVSGLLVNMVNRTLKLISPCYTTLEYRYGYRVFDEMEFDDSPGGFTRALQRLVARNMIIEPYPEMPVRWRDDLKVVPHPEGFTLLSPNTQRDFRRGEMHVRTAELVSRGDMTYEEVFDALSDNPNIGPLVAMSVLSSLFKRGYLCEMAIARDHRERYEAASA